MLWVIIGIFLFIVLLITLKFQLKFEYRLSHDIHQLVLTVSILWGLISYQKNIDFRHQNRGNKQKSSAKLPDVDFLDLLRLIFDFLQKMILRKLEIHYHIGDPDSVKTALFYGSAWSVTGSALGILQQIFRFDCMPKIAITPMFYQKTFHFTGTCIIDFRLGHLIWAGIKLIFNMTRIKQWKIWRFSYG